MKSNERPPHANVSHSSLVVDPYLWLEDRSSTQTTHWLDDQKKRLNHYFCRLGPLDDIRAKVTNYVDTEFVDQPGRVGDRCFFTRRAIGVERAEIIVQERNSGERVLYMLKFH